MFRFLKNKTANLFSSREEKLKKDLDALLQLLKDGDTDFLLASMQNHAHYSPWIDYPGRNMFSSDDRVSWYAFEFARKLNTPAHKERLLQKLGEENSPKTRQHIYYCLSFLCGNTADGELFAYLMHELDKEENAPHAMDILLGLEKMDKPAHYDIAVLIKTAEQGEEDASYHALAALAHTHHHGVEEILLNHLNTGSDRIRLAACCSLGSVGTRSAIPYLENAHKRTRDFGYRASIEQSITSIKSRN